MVQYNPRSVNRTFNPTYRIGNQELGRKESCRDLGIIISEDLKFHLQTDSTCKRANYEINRIRRSFISREPHFLSNIFKLYVRPHLEYCVEVWNPEYEGDIQKLERVQNKMTRLLRQGSYITPENRNKILGLTTHRKRRLRGDLNTIFKSIRKKDIFRLKESSRIQNN